MKKLIPLFTFTFGLHLSLLALSISSDKIDTFMHLPDWMPTCVDETHTFGSDGHTNSNRRTTIDTLAAVESIFEAYHERVFFMSEGRSNNWNQAEYGPRPTDEEALADILFTNEYRNAQNSFVYRCLTNAPAHPREVYDTRRLVEFQNLFELVERIPSEFFNGPSDRTIPMPVVPTWTPNPYPSFVERPLYVGSSWMPGKLYPKPFGWRSSFPSLNLYDFTNSCLPVYECTPDDTFRKGNYWYSQETVGDYSYYLHARFVATATFGDLDEWVPYVGNYWTTLSVSRPWVGDTVADIIRTNFPKAGPDAGMTNLTRRLVPDDFTVYNVTSYLEKVDEKLIEVSLESVRPSGTIVHDPGWQEYFIYYDLSSYEFDFESNILRSTSWTVSVSEPPGYPEETLTAASDIQVFSKGSKFDKVSVREEFGPIGWLLPWDEPDDWYWDWFQDGTLLFEAWRLVTKTNSVSAASSPMATASRALAMLDRTYEIPENSYRGVITSNELAKASADVKVSGFGKVPDGEAGEWELVSTTKAVCPVDETADDIVVSMDQTGVDRSFETELTGANYSTTAKYRFSGIHTSTRRIEYLPMDFPTAEYGSEPPGVPPSTDFIYNYELLMPNPGEFYVRSVGTTSGETYVRRLHFNSVGHDPHIEASTVLYQTAALETTTPAMRGGVDASYSHYGPGPLAFRTGRVGECRCTILAGIMKLVGIRQGDGFFDEGQWRTMDHDLSWTTDDDTLKYDRSLLYSASGDEVSQNSGVISLVTGALNANGWARGKLFEVCEADIGGKFGPSFLQPSFSQLVINHENIAKYNGGHYYVEIPGNGPTRWPLPPLINCGFAVKAKGEPIELDMDKAFTAPVSGDLHLSNPLISTQWNWKALKSERNNK